MKHRSKKLWSILLSLVLALSLVPAFSMTAFADGDSSYTLTIPSELSVANSGWNDAGGISATGTLASGKKLTVTASSANSFKLKSGNNEVGYTLATAPTDTEATTSWTFDSLSSTATKKDMGIIVEDYSAKPAGTYQDTVTFTAKVESASIPVTGITLNKTATTIQAGNKETLSASGFAPNDATYKTVTWSSDNTDVATVNAQTGEVTAVAAGTATITATATDGGGATATCTVTVTPATRTVTWNKSDTTGGSGKSFTKDGITVTAGAIDFRDANFMGGGTFTTASGKFTKIEVNMWGYELGTGWSSERPSAWIWTGNASSVSFNNDIMGGMMDENATIVFTIEE